MPWLVMCFQRRYTSVTPAFTGGNPSTAAIASLLEANAQKSKTDEDGTTTLESHPFPRCGGPQAFMLMMAQRAPESLAHSIDKVTLHSMAQHAELGNSVLRECVMGSSRQGQQLLCHGQQPVRGNSLSWATAYMSWATAC